VTKNVKGVERAVKEAFAGTDDKCTDPVEHSIVPVSVVYTPLSCLWTHANHNAYHYVLNFILYLICNVHDDWQ
jgi:hypothetical protein